MLKRFLLRPFLGLQPTVRSPSVTQPEFPRYLHTPEAGFCVDVARNGTDDIAAAHEMLAWLVCIAHGHLCPPSTGR